MIDFVGAAGARLLGRVDRGGLKKAGLKAQCAMRDEDISGTVAAMRARLRKYVTPDAGAAPTAAAQAATSAP